MARGCGRCRPDVRRRRLGPGPDRPDARRAGGAAPAPAPGRGDLFPAARPFRQRRSRQRPRRLCAPAAGQRLRPDRHRLLSRRRPGGGDPAAGLYPGPGRDGRVAGAHLQEQAGPDARKLHRRGAPRLLDQRLHHGRSPFRRRGDDGRPGRCGPCAGHEGLSGHRGQPHRRRHPLSRMPPRTTAPIAAAPTIPIHVRAG